MAFDNTPNKLESAFIQRDTSNQYYEQVNVSGSDLVIYHGPDGKLTADKIQVWAALYGIGMGVADVARSASWASSSKAALIATQSWYATQSHFATQSLYASQSNFSTESLFTLQSLYATQSIYATQSLVASQSLFATQSLTASFIEASKVFGTVLSSSWAETASFAFAGASGIADTAKSASVGFFATDGNIWGYVPWFSQGGHMSASNISITNGGTAKIYASNLTSPPLERVFYIGRDGNTNTWAALGHYNDAGAIDEKYWINYADQSGILNFLAASDDFAIQTTWLRVTRDGAAISEILFNRPITINGNVLPQADFSHSLGTGSLRWRTGYIDKLFGTASWATSSFTASYLTFVPITAVSASWVSSSLSSSFSTTASFALVAQSVQGTITNAQFALSASWASSSISSSVALTASVLLGSVERATFSTSASFASQSLSSSNALTASVVLGSVAYATTAGSASWASASISSSAALTSSTTLSIPFTGSENYLVKWRAGNVLSPDSLILDNYFAVGINTPVPDPNSTLTVTANNSGYSNWNPSEISTPMRLWYRSDAITASNGELVDYWPDSGDFGNHLTASTVANRPTYIANSGFNNRPLVRFSGNPVWLMTVSGSQEIPMNTAEVFAVATVNVMNTDIITGDNHGLLANYLTNSFGGPNPYSGSFRFGPKSYGAVSQYYWEQTTETISSSVSMRASVPLRAANLGKTWIVNSHINTSSSFIRSYLSGSVSRSAVSVESGNFNLRDLRMGWEQQNNRFFVGDVFEVMVFDNSLSDEERYKVEGYLAWKYNLQDNLNTTHSYKTSAPSGSVGAQDIQTWRDLNGNLVGHFSSSGILYATTSIAKLAETASLLLGSIETASFAYTASFVAGAVESASYSYTASQAIMAETASLVIGSISDAVQSVSSSFASASISSSNSVSSSYAFNATTASHAAHAALASLATTASYALTSSFPWNITSSGNLGSVYHPDYSRQITIGTSGSKYSSKLYVFEPDGNSITQSIAAFHGLRNDNLPVKLDVRNLAAGANVVASVTVGVGTPLGLESGHMFFTRTAAPASGIVSGLNFSVSSSTQDIGFRVGSALSNSVAGPHLQIKSTGMIGMGVAAPANARLHIGGTDIPFYNATLRMTNGAAGGADVFFAATDDAWGSNITTKLLIGTGDPGSGTQIMQLYPPSASVGIGIQSNVTPQAKLHVQGNITASSVTASVWGTASWAENTLNANFATLAGSSSYAGTASILLGSIDSATFALSASWASQSLSSSNALTASTALNVDTASYANLALSASYAPGSPSISSSYSLTASYALNGGSGPGGPNSRVIVMCSAFTPYFSGADAAEIPVPYDSDGITPVSWSVNRLNLRVQFSGSTTSSVTLEKSSMEGAFVSDLTLGTLVLNSSSYQTFTGSGANVVSGDKIRFNVGTIGTSQYWTITAEMTSL